MSESLAYRAVVTDAAAADLHDLGFYLETKAPHVARRWLRGLMHSIDSLALSPARCALAPEAETFEKELRHLLYGRRRNIYRIVFLIKPAARVDEIVRVMHGARAVARPQP